MPGEADVGGVDVEFSREHVDERFSSFYLQLSRVGGFAVGNDADSDWLSAVACAPRRNSGVLSVPSVGSLDETIVSAKAVADDEVAIEVL